MFTPKYKVGDIVKAEIFKNEWELCIVENIIKKKFFKFEYIITCHSYKGAKCEMRFRRKQKDLIAVRGNKGE